MTRFIILAIALSSCGATNTGHPAIVVSDDYAMVIQDSELTLGGNMAKKSASVGIKIRWGSK